MIEGEEPLLIGGAGKSPPITPEIAGSKAAELSHMAALGLDIPPAFVVPTNLCMGIIAGEDRALNALQRNLDKGIAWLEGRTGRRFGDVRSPLLVSVRSGAAKSMPGMLQTILNVGLNNETVRGLIRTSGNPRLAYDSYRRLVQGYGEVVDGVPGAEFERHLCDFIRREGITCEAELDPEALERLTGEFRELARRSADRMFPDDPREQLQDAAVAVFRSWESPRAREYRRLNDLVDLRGTAVTVQAMVFGNAGRSSGAGVAFSRDPATGANELFVDFLFDSQGEDVVSGRRTPSHAANLEARLPSIAKGLAEGVRRIERDARDVQDVEFTVENGRLYFLQTRNAKRSPHAALRIAVDMVREGMIDRETALSRLVGIDLDRLYVTRFAEPAQAAATAISASAGVATGRVAFSPERAKELAFAGDPVILVRADTSTEDLEGFAAADGILTAHGGRTAHAAVVARHLGKVCLVGCRLLAIDDRRHEAMIGPTRIREGDWLSLDGDDGTVALGKRTIVTERPPELAEVERWRTEAAAAKAT